jgi:membrane-bound lytic murein transglycosylase B
MKNMKNTKIIISSLFFVGAMSFLYVFLPAPVLHAEDSADELEDDIEDTEKKLKEAEQKYGALQSSYNQINSNLTSTQTAILRVTNLLNQTTQTIEQKETEIANLDKQLTFERKILGSLLQELYLSDATPLAEVILTKADVASLFQNKDGLLSTQEKISSVIDDISDTKSKLSEEKSSLEEAKKDHEELLVIQNKQKQTLAYQKGEVQEDLEDQATIVNRLKKELSELQGDLSELTGKSYNAKDIREAVEDASDETGVPEGVLYGFLKMETNLGANTGQCTYSEVEKVSVARYKKYGSKYKASIALLYKRQDIFYDIVEDLGYSKTKKVSCSPNYIGQGGAMGVAQFMSDVWRGYESEIRAKTGHKTPDPWSLTDGVMAMALKLRKAGATSSSPSVIKQASINYLGAYNAHYYNGILYWAKNYKQLFD